MKNGKKLNIYVGGKLIGQTESVDICLLCSKAVKSKDHICIPDYEVKRTLKSVN